MINIICLPFLSSEGSFPKMINMIFIISILKFYSKDCWDGIMREACYEFMKFQVKFYFILPIFYQISLKRGLLIISVSVSLIVNSKQIWEKNLIVSLFRVLEKYKHWLDNSKISFSFVHIICL